MAHFLDNYEPPTFRDERSSNTGLIVGVIILVLAIGLVVYFLSQPTTASSVQTVQQQAPVAQENSVPAVVSTASSAPNVNTKCSVVAGIVPGSIKTTASTVSVTFKNNGHLPIEGSYFEFSAGDKKSYQKNSDAVAPGKSISYTVNLDDASTALGMKVTSFVVLPIQDGQACLNQRMIVIG